MFSFFISAVCVCAPCLDDAAFNHYRTTAHKTRPHYPDDSPSFYRSDFQGGLNRAPVSAHSMEFLRGIYAFMQVSRSSVSDQTPVFHEFFFLELISLAASQYVCVYCKLQCLASQCLHFPSGSGKLFQKSPLKSVQRSRKMIKNLNQKKN